MEQKKIKDLLQIVEQTQNENQTQLNKTNRFSAEFERVEARSKPASNFKNMSEVSTEDHTQNGNGAYSKRTPLDSQPDADEIVPEKEYKPLPLYKYKEPPSSLADGQLGPGTASSQHPGGRHRTRLDEADKRAGSRDSSGENKIKPMIDSL